MRRVTKATAEQIKVSEMLQAAWKNSNWPSIRQFVAETRIPLAEYTVGRILVHGDIPSIESVLQLGCYMCSRDDVIKMLKLLGDQMIHKYLEPDGITTEERRWLLAFHSMPAEMRNTAIKMLESLKGE